MESCQHARSSNRRTPMSPGRARRMPRSFAQHLAPCTPAPLHLPLHLSPTGIMERLEGSTPSRPRRSLWLLVPVVVGTAAGIAVAVFPIGRHLLVFAVVLSGLSWLLRIASDWMAEHAGPQRGIVALGVVLFGTWLALVIASPRQLEELGFGPLRTPAEPADPYALPPAGSRGPLATLQGAPPDDDEVDPLKKMLTPARPPPPPSEPPAPPADGSPGTPDVAIQLSSSVSRAGEGVVLVARVQGDGRPVRGYLEFLVDEVVVDRRLVRVQGAVSQAEFRLVGLKPGAHALRARFRGSRTVQPRRLTRRPASRVGTVAGRVDGGAEPG